MDKEIPIISIVAWSGTGKTTFLEKLIPVLKNKGLRVGVIKHDAHRFEIDKEGKDSWRLTQAGADVTALISPDRAVIMENRAVELEHLIAEISDVDLLLTEGYKFGNWPKILLYRKELGKPIPIDPQKCFAVVSDVSIHTSCPLFSLDEVDLVADLICSRVPHFA